MYSINSQDVLWKKPISFWLDVFDVREDSPEYSLEESKSVDTVKTRAVKSLPING